MFRQDPHDPLPPPSHRWALRQFEDGRESHLTPGGPTTHVLKAVEGGRGEAVGFAIIRVYGGEGGGATGMDVEGGAGGEGDDVDDGLDHEFCEVWIQRMKEIYERCMDGKDHGCKCSLSLHYSLTCPPSMDIHLFRTLKVGRICFHHPFLNPHLATDTNILSPKIGAPSWSSPPGKAAASAPQSSAGPSKISISMPCLPS